MNSHFADNNRKKLNADLILRNIELITLVGTLHKQKNARYIHMFVQGSQKHPDLKMKLLCATSGVGNTGINCPDFCDIYRIDFPPSILDITQGKGQAGR